MQCCQEKQGHENCDHLAKCEKVQRVLLDVCADVYAPQVEEKLLCCAFVANAGIHL